MHGRSVQDVVTWEGVGWEKLDSIRPQDNRLSVLIVMARMEVYSA